MTSSAELIKQLDIQFNLISLSHKEAQKLIPKQKLRDLEKSLERLEERYDKIRDIKQQIQESQLEEGTPIDEVEKWGDELDERIEATENPMAELQKAITSLKNETEENRKEQEELKELKRVKERREEEIKLEEIKIKMRMDYERTLQSDIAKNPSNENSSKVKLPKLQITKFQGTHLDWLRFWSQYEHEIDKSQLDPVTKFSYLKELLLPKVRLMLDGLPFNTEGYTRATTILKTKFGRPSEVANAHIQSIISLPPITNANPRKIHEFYEKLATSVQSLETMGKLKEINGYVRLTIDKLPGIRADLVRLDDDWQEWKFPKLLESLRTWTERNPITEQSPSNSYSNERNRQYREKLLQTNQREFKPRKCVFCDSGEHKSADCDKVTKTEDRRRVLRDKRLCFNCTGDDHRAFNCRSKRSCMLCERRHHTSVCDKRDQKKTPFLTTGEEKVIYPVVIVDVHGIKCRALLDTGAGSSYASSNLLNAIKSKASRIETKTIDMMMTSTSQKLEIHGITIESLDKSYKLNCEVTKVEKNSLLTVSNPNYRDITQKYAHLRDVVMDDIDDKLELPIHIVLGASEYSQIKMEVKPKIGKPKEPIAERTQLGWTIISSGREGDMTKMLLTRSSEADYQQLCSLDVLGLLSPTEKENNEIFDEFTDQLVRSEEGWYETGLLWRENHPHLPSNKSNSLGRLRNLLFKLKRDPELFEDYDAIISKQLREGIIQEVPQEPSHKTSKEYYIPHKPVVDEKRETTKIRVVYDASSKETSSSPSLNECLKESPSMQNLLWSVLIRNRMKPVAICGDLKQAFLQIRIRESDRDSLRFHWIKDKDPNSIVTMRFTRALFGLTQSPFFLAAIIEHHLNRAAEEDNAEIIQEIKDDLYIDDLIGGAEDITTAKTLKEESIRIFNEAGFVLHKWHSNVSSLESEHQQETQEQTYAKQQLNTKPLENKILGLKWDKREDQLSITFPDEHKTPSKRSILGKLASIYDPLGQAGPITLQGKQIYREVCDQKLSWDEDLPEHILRRWNKWEKSLPPKLKFNRSIMPQEFETTEIHLHAFGDASQEGTGAAVYVVAYNNESFKQGLLAAKARLSKKKLTIPRLELIAAHMAANLIENVKESLKSSLITSLTCWSDSSTVLYWLKTNSPLKPFVSNRVNKIKENTKIDWRYVPSTENTADIASRGCRYDQLPDTWLKGPSWLPVKERWPENILLQSTTEAEQEVKHMKEVFATTLRFRPGEFETLLEKFTFHKFIRIASWIQRFISNCQKNVRTGQLTTEEILSQEKFWIKQSQKSFENTTEFTEDRERLNLQKNSEDIYECRGRIQGSYPIYIHQKSPLAKKIIENSHLKTLHGGVSQTMTDVRERFWIPKLRKLVKSVIYHCYGCKRYRAVAFANPPPGQLPISRTVGDRAFQIVGTDYAGPIMYRQNKKQESKAYILLFSCSLSRAIHIELVPDLTTDEFIRSFKRFVARRGRPERIYSDNAKTFKAAAKWIDSVIKSERFQDHLSQNKIFWNFNLSRAPWWGGQFERLIGIIKQALYRTIGRGLLKWDELQEVLLDVEQSINNRPLCYVEDDIELPIITPNSLIFGQENRIPETTDAEEIADRDLRKRYKFVKSCKTAVWNRWTNEYIKSLRERHNLKHNKKITEVKPGDVVMIKGESKNRGNWKVGVVHQVYPGRDNVIRAVQVKVEKSNLERPVQLLYPLELTCDIAENNCRQVTTKLDVTAKEFRPKRNAAAVARLKIGWNREDEENEQ